MHVEIPDECKHQAGNEGLEHQGLVREKCLDQAEHKEDRNGYECKSWQDR
jgi:hypothetical protein